MLIGQLVNETGLTKDAIRFYEKQGLIKVSHKERRDNNYKEYSNEILQRLLTVKRLKNFGFTLNEVSDLLEMIEVNEATCNNVASKIGNKIELLDQKIKELKQIRNMLLKGAKKCEGYCNPDRVEDNCPILIPEKRER